MARELLRIGAIVFRPDDQFVWASGIRSPVYVDNRLSISYPEVRSHISEAFESVLRAEGLDPAAIVGTATAGIPHAAWLAERLELPMAYVRGTAKQHGRRNRIEGQIGPGTHVVVVEDLVSTGGSSLDVVRALREEGITVDAVLAIFSYGLQGASRAFEQEGVRLFVLTDFEALLRVAADVGALASADVEAVRQWHGRLAAGEMGGKRE